MIEAPVVVLDVIRWVLMVLTIPVVVFVFAAVWESHTMAVRCVYISYSIFIVGGLLDRINALGEDYFTYSLPLYIIGIGFGLFAAFDRFLDWRYAR
jgi:hypothetical protein